MFALVAGCILGAMLVFASWFYKRQNGPDAAVGGPISKPKALWLSYTIGSWFLFPFVFYFHPDVSQPLKIVIVIHLVSWWVRGPLELVMIYKWLNWTPVYGITHDILHIMAVFFGTSWAVADLGLEQMTRSANALTFSFLAAVIFSTIAEILFAALFFATRDKTDHLIYFADETDRYRIINRFTATICTIVYLHLVMSIVGLAFN